MLLRHALWSEPSFNDQFEAHGAGNLPQCWTSAVVTFPLAFALTLHLPRQFTSASLRPFFRPELWGHSSVGLVLRAAFFSSGSHEIFKLGYEQQQACVLFLPLTRRRLLARAAAGRWGWLGGLRFEPKGRDEKFTTGRVVVLCCVVCYRRTDNERPPEYYRFLWWHGWFVFCSTNFLKYRSLWNKIFMIHLTCVLYRLSKKLQMLRVSYCLVSVTPSRPALFDFSVKYTHCKLNSISWWWSS